MKWNSLRPADRFTCNLQEAQLLVTSLCCVQMAVFDLPGGAWHGSVELKGLGHAHVRAAQNWWQLLFAHAKADHQF